MILDRFDWTVRLRSSPAPAPASVTAAPSASPRPAPASCSRLGRPTSWKAPRPRSARPAARRSPSPPTSTTTASSSSLVNQTLAEYGRIDVLVNNAGGTMPGPALHLQQQDFEAAFHFNVGTAFQLTKLCAPHMAAKDGGAVVNISSAMSYMVDPGFVAYGTAKAALSHMTRLLACEWAPRIRVNALAVGATETEALGMFLNAAARRSSRRWST